MGGAAAGSISSACSGIWLSRPTNRRTRARPSRVDNRSTSAPTSSCATAPPLQPQLARVEPLGQHYVEPDQVVSETGIERIGERVDPLREQPHQNRHVARRPPRLDPQALHLPVGAEQPRLPASPAFMPLLQRMRRFAGEFGEHLQRIFGARDRFGEAPLGRHGRRHPPRRDGRLRLPRQASDRGRRSLAEPRRDGGKRPRHDVAHRLQPCARERRAVLLVQPERRDGQPPHRALLVGGGGARISRQRQCHLRRVAERVPRKHAAPRQPRLHIGGERPLALEGVGAAGDVQQQRVGRMQRHRRRIAPAPVRQPLQPVVIGVGVGGKHFQLGHPRARIGERQAGREPRLDRGPVECDEPHRLSDRLDEADRAFTPSDEQMRAGRSQPLHRQPGEHQRQPAPSHGTGY